MKMHILSYVAKYQLSNSLHVYKLPLKCNQIHKKSKIKRIKLILSGYNIFTIHQKQQNCSSHRSLMLLFFTLFPDCEIHWLFYLICSCYIRQRIILFSAATARKDTCRKDFKEWGNEAKWVIHCHLCSSSEDCVCLLFWF